MQQQTEKPFPSLPSASNKAVPLTTQETLVRQENWNFCSNKIQQQAETHRITSTGSQ
jgi:hypothetical protein